MAMFVFFPLLFYRVNKIIIDCNFIIYKIKLLNLKINNYYNIDIFMLKSCGFNYLKNITLFFKF